MNTASNWSPPRILDTFILMQNVVDSGDIQDCTSPPACIIFACNLCVIFLIQFLELTTIT